jgi:3-oxoacyl-[acyl-carrier-protein] synthase I
MNPNLLPTTDAIAIIASGAVTSVGGSAASSCAAIRSSLDNFQETHFIDEIGQPLLGARVSDELLGLAQEEGSITGGNTRLAAMFVRAATECVHQIGGIDAKATALLLVGPEVSRPGFSLQMLEECFAACQQAIGQPFHEASRITQLGSPGLAAALHYAQQLLNASSSQNPSVRHVLIAGLDSLLNTEDINAGLAQERLLSSENSDGFIPGEAAACLLVTRLSGLDAQDELGQTRVAVLKVAGLGLAQESASYDSDIYNSGKGLAQAFKMALEQAQLQAHHIHHRLSDASGEEFFMDEATYAWGRVQRAPSPVGYFSLLTGSSVGHVGAASGTLLSALALDMVRKNWAAGPNILVHMSSSHTERGALVLQAV